MAYDTRLAERIRSVVSGRQGVAEREMFGGLGFLKDGVMFSCILGRELLVRVGSVAPKAATRPFARPLDLLGYSTSGCVLVQPGGLASDDALASWLDESLAHAASASGTTPRRPPTATTTGTRVAGRAAPGGTRARP